MEDAMKNWKLVLALLVPIYLILAHISVADSFVNDCFGIFMGTVVTLGCYYMLFLGFRGTLRWAGRQLNHDR